MASSGCGIWEEFEESDWRHAHGAMIAHFLHHLNKKTDQFVLKSGTALMLCYGLRRFSEEIFLDGLHQDITGLVQQYCVSMGMEYRVAKDTATVTRCFIHYTSSGKPLKIEVSYRNQALRPESCPTINGLKVYPIEDLSLMVASAYSARDTIHDLFDLSFICNNYLSQLSAPVVNSIRMSVLGKSIEQFDYILATQDDPLIDKYLLAENFLLMHKRLGLLVEGKPHILDAKRKLRGH